MKYNDYNCNVLISKNKKIETGMSSKKMIFIGDFSYSIIYDDEIDRFIVSVDISKPNFDITINDVYLQKDDINRLTDIIKDIRNSFTENALFISTILTNSPINDDEKEFKLSFETVVSEDMNIDDWRVRINIMPDIYVILHAAEIINLCEYLTDIQYYL